MSSKKFSILNIAIFLSLKDKKCYVHICNHKTWFFLIRLILKCNVSTFFPHGPCAPIKKTWSRKKKDDKHYVNLRLKSSSSI